MANNIKLQRKYCHPCWVGPELLNCPTCTLLFITKKSNFLSHVIHGVFGCGLRSEVPILTYIVLSFQGFLGYFSSFHGNFPPGKPSRSGLAKHPFPSNDAGLRLSLRWVSCPAPAGPHMHVWECPSEREAVIYSSGFFRVIFLCYSLQSLKTVCSTLWQKVLVMLLAH